MIEDDAVFCTPALESKTEILGSILQENTNMVHNSDHSGHGSSQVSDINCDQTQDEDVKSEDEGVKDEVFQTLDESSSFYSGSISLRSDSSTASSQSFAFPM